MEMFFMRRVDHTKFFFIFLGSFLFLFILIPIVNLIFSASPDSIMASLNDKEVMSSLFYSCYAALTSTVLGVLFGVPLAYILSRFDFKGKKFVESVIDIPVVIPHTVSGIALLLVFSSTGLLGGSLKSLGLVFSDAFPGVVVAMLFVSSSFIVNSSREGFESVDPKMEKVAKTLGSGSFKTFFLITLPLSIRSIMIGAVMAWARAISEFGAIIIIAYYPVTAPLLIYNRFVGLGLSDSLPIAVILISLCLIFFFIVRTIMGRWRTYDKD